MTDIPAFAPSATLFTRLVRWCREVLADASSAAVPELDQASELPPRLRYDVGLSDLCPDRMVSARSRQNDF